MLGEKRSQSLFAPKASAEKAAATHITTGPDGRKKELPLYFGPDCPVSGNMGQNQHEAGVGEPQPADEPLRHAPADDGTGVEADPTDSVNMAEDLPRRSLNTESAGGYRAHSLFFTPENEGQDFNTVLQDVQEYISGKYSALITEGGDEDAKAQIKRYITKYVQDRRIAVKGYSGDQLVDALYTEMAEFGLLTKYIFGTGIEEINVNSWRDIEVLYANGETVKLEEHFDSPEHAVNVIRRMLHVSGMVLDNASPAVLGHLSKNIRIAVLKTPLVDEDVGVTASIRIVNPQNMQKKDFVKGGTATGPMLDFLAACLRYGVSVCVAGATGSGKTTVAGWLLTTIPDNKRIFTIENGSRELDLVREKDGRVCNSVIHTITRESENAKQNIDQDIISGLLKGAAEFYGASRASVVEADWDLGIGVITYEWCKDGVSAQRDMLQCLPMEKFPRWRKALRANKPVVISDLQRLEKVYPDEAAFFREYGVTTLLAAPFSKRINQGFIAVDDPTRYTDDPVFLFIASYAVVVELNEIKQQQSLLAATKASKYNPEDIHVNFFGGMEIISSKGTLTGEDIKADQCYLLLAYLILNHKKNSTVDTLAEIICPYDELDSPYKVVNNIVYRLRRTLSVIGLDKLVIGKNGTFQINPNFNIHTDFDRFEDACIQLKTEENPDMRHSLYHSAVDMYKGQLLPRCEHELWLMQLSMYYQSLYLQITKGYVRLKMECKDYILAQKTAIDALRFDPKDSELNMYAILAMGFQGNLSMAQTYYTAAKPYLALEHAEVIKKYLNIK